MNATIKTFLSERVIQENIITDVEVTGTTIRVSLTPKIEKKYERPDCQEAVAAYYNDSETVTVQGLGIQGKALRYQVTNIRLGYLNDAGEFKTFNAPVTGVRSDLLVTDEVVDKFLYFDVDRNQSLAESVQLLQDVYGVQSSVSAVERWKKGEAEALPPVGQLIIMLNKKRRSLLCIWMNTKPPALKVGNWLFETNMVGYSFQFGSKDAMPGISRQFCVGSEC